MAHKRARFFLSFFFFATKHAITSKDNNGFYEHSWGPLPSLIHKHFSKSKTCQGHNGSFCWVFFPGKGTLMREIFFFAVQIAFKKPCCPLKSKTVVYKATGSSFLGNVKTQIKSTELLTGYTKQNS